MKTLLCVCMCVCVQANFRTYLRCEARDILCWHKNASVCLWVCAKRIHLLFVWRSYERLFVLYQKLTHIFRCSWRGIKITTLFLVNFWTLFRSHFGVHMGSIWDPSLTSCIKYVAEGREFNFGSFLGLQGTPKQPILGTLWRPFFRLRFLMLLGSSWSRRQRVKS